MRKFVDKLLEHGVFVFASAPVLVALSFIQNLDTAPLF
jgi:hypothetical protein